MATIGNFGRYITFEVTSNRILSFSDMKRNVAGRYKKHNILGQAPKLEFQGQDSSEVTMDVVLSAENGVRPRTVLDNLESAVRTGALEYLVVGGRIVGQKKMCLTSVSEEWDCVWSRGELVKAKVSLNFTESN